VHRVLAQGNPDAGLAAMIVWIEMLAEDKEADITALAREMSDPRIRWFHDPRHRAGRAIATSLGGTSQIAWDVYLFFDAGVEWEKQLPAPRHWTHQLSDAWADPTRLHFNDQLAPELDRLIKTILRQ
jgi:hypothetical protein